MGFRHALESRNGGFPQRKTVRSFFQAESTAAAKSSMVAAGNRGAGMVTPQEVRSTKFALLGRMLLRRIVRSSYLFALSRSFFARILPGFNFLQAKVRELWLA